MLSKGKNLCFIYTYIYISNNDKNLSIQKEIEKKGITFELHKKRLIIERVQQHDNSS